MPPETNVRAPVEPFHIPTLPSLPQPSSLLVGVAAVDRSGRFGERTLLTALGWTAGNRLRARSATDAIILHPADTGPFHIDSRNQIALTAGSRSYLDVRAGDRIVLVANPDTNTLIIHPHHLVAGLLAGYYAAWEGSEVDHGSALMTLAADAAVRGVRNDVVRYVGER